MSTVPLSASSDSRGSLYGQDSGRPYSPSIGPSNRSVSSSIAAPSQVASSKGKQPASAADSSSETFLAILFDREDYLRAISDSEDEDEEGEENAQAGQKKKGWFTSMFKR